VHAVLEEAFGDHWGHQEQPFERWTADNASGPSYDPSLWRLAWREGRLAGVVIAVILEGRGWITLLGVERASRGRGVAALLLRHAFGALADRGVRSAYLAVDAENPTGATVLYENVGMRVVKRWDLWELTLPA
jgi:ribosomal protein S18 acetylase RimI-like enzyme